MIERKSDLETKDTNTSKEENDQTKELHSDNNHNNYSLLSFHYTRGSNLQNHNEYKNAIREFDKALTFWPNHFAPTLNRAFCYLSLQKYPEAIVDLEQCKKLTPTTKNSMIYYHLSQAYFHSNQFQKASENITEAIKLYPSNSAYLNTQELINSNLISNTIPEEKSMLHQDHLEEKITNTLTDEKDQKKEIHADKIKDQNPIPEYKNELEKKIHELEEKQNSQKQFYENQISNLSNRIDEIRSNVKTPKQFFEDMLISYAKEGDVRKIKIAYEMGADVNAVDSAGKTAIFHSFWERRSETNPHSSDAIKFLLEKGADLEIPNARGDTILHAACRFNGINLVRSILKVFPTIDKEAKTLLSAIDILNVESNRENIRKAIANKILFQAAKQGNKELAEKALFEKEANINAQDEDGETALHMACRGSEDKIVEFLLKERINIYLTDNNAETAINISTSDAIKKLITDYQNENATVIQAEYRRFFSQKNTKTLKERYIKTLQQESSIIFAEWAKKGEYKNIIELAGSFINERFHHAKKMIHGIPEIEMKESKGAFTVKY